MGSTRKPGTDARLKAVRAGGPEEVLAALDDPSAVVVEAAAQRLSQPRAAGALLRAYLRLHEGAPLSDSGCWARMAILEALARLEAPEGEDAARLAVRSVQVEAVGFGLSDTATGLRVAGAGLLANLRVPDALIDLAWLLHDFVPNANCSAAEAPFAKMAARVAAARAIGALGDPAGAAILGVKLAFPHAEVPDVLAECMDALVALREPRAFEFLQPWLASTNPYLVATAGTALAAADGLKALPLLVSALEDAVADAREPLVYAIGSIRADAAREALLRLAEHPDKRISKVAKELTE
ncbi:MAG: hypothetical protein JWN15_3551 [Firmicutes bacterium]|nr:hypothetical protein [Bacillota bacterium]